MKLDLDIQNASGSDHHPSTDEMTQWVMAALDNRLEQAELAIRIVNEAEISQLNSDYRHKQGPTNVLSFPADLHPGVDVPLLGDLVICAPVVEREAIQQSKSLQAHWAHMVIHGTLHLLGYDHIEDHDADVMEGLEIELLKHMNFPNPYVLPQEECTQNHE